MNEMQIAHERIRQGEWLRRKGFALTGMMFHRLADNVIMPVLRQRAKDAAEQARRARGE